MATNVEVKIRVDNLDDVRIKACALADQGPFLLKQVDYFFPVANGRLKLRVQSSSQPGEANGAELIAYERSDDPRPRASDYLLCPTQSPDLLRETLMRSLGKGTVVRKSRELILIGRTRVHLDSVENLGSFVEIEVVMREGESLDVGRHELQQIVTLMDLDDQQIQNKAYADLLETCCD